MLVLLHLLGAHLRPLLDHLLDGAQEHVCVGLQLVDRVGLTEQAHSLGLPVPDDDDVRV
jgi:hypothetical protein